MGVIKNDVGRPSNKTLKIRMILRLIVVLIVVALIVGVCYFVKNNASTKKTVDKYKKLNFTKNTEIISAYIIEKDDLKNFIEVEVEISLDNGVVTANKGTNKQEVRVDGINSKIKYIDGFCEEEYGPYIINPIALAENGELYIGTYNSEENSFKFNLISKDIKKILLTTQVAGDTYNSPESKIYALTDKNELLEVKYNQESNEFFMSEDKYEDGYLYVGNYHEGFTAYNAIVKLSDKSLSFYLNEAFTPVKYDSKNVKVKEVFIGAEYDNENSDNNEHYIYIIDEDNNLLTNKEKYNSFEKISCDGCYELKKAYSSKVKDYKTEYYDDKHIVKITFEDNFEKEIEYYYSTGNELY